MNVDTDPFPRHAPDRLCRTLLPNSSLTSRAASSRHGCPGPSTPADGRACSARPATVTLSRTSSPAISARAFPGRPAPSKSPGPAGRVNGMHARLSRTRQAGTRDRRGQSVAVRGKPTVHTDRPGGRTPSAICPWTPRHKDLQRDEVTHDGTEETTPLAREFAASGPFSQVVAGVGFEPTYAEPTVLQTATAPGRRA